MGGCFRCRISSHRADLLLEASCAWWPKRIPAAAMKLLHFVRRSVSGPTWDRSRSSLTYDGARRWEGRQREPAIQWSDLCSLLRRCIHYTLTICSGGGGRNVDGGRTTPGNTNPSKRTKNEKRTQDKIRGGRGTVRDEPHRDREGGHGLGLSFGTGDRDRTERGHCSIKKGHAHWAFIATLLRQQDGWMDLH